MSISRRSWVSLVLLLLGGSAGGCRADESLLLEETLPGSAPAAAKAPKGEATAPGFNPRLLRRFGTLPAHYGDEASPAVVDLGRILYHEPRLSKDGDLSCNSCHRLDRYGADGERTSRGHGGTRGTRNALTVYNAAGCFAQFWDGRAADVEAQALGPILSPAEMAMESPAHVVEVLTDIPGYVERFEKAFPDQATPLSFANVGVAIAAFERGLVTPSRWDRYLDGDAFALTALEIEGLRTFTNVGCMVCHTGPLVGGSMFEKVGAVEDWPNQTDRGRYEVTHDPVDDMMFKVPTLRNIAETAPYFHDGSAASLPEAVRMMGRHQLGLELADGEVGAIVAWLHALTGQLPEAYIRAPELPGHAVPEGGSK